MAHLVIHEPGQVTLAVPLRDGLRVGRTEPSELLVLDDRVSRQHVVFLLRGDTWWIEDLDSRNGTAVNGTKIQSQQLADGDQIQLGRVHIEFFAGDVHQEVVHEQQTGALPPSMRSDDTTDRRLRLVCEVSRAIGDLTDVDELMTRMANVILDVLQCERVLIGVANDTPGSLRRYTRTRELSPDDGIVLSRAMVDAMIGRGQAVIFRTTGAPDEPLTLIREGIRSAMGAPLTFGSRQLGLIYVDDCARADRFSQQDLDFLVSLGHLTAAALAGAERIRVATALAEAAGADGPTADLLGNCDTMLQLKTQVQKYGAASANVLIRGESGTGKEIVARLLHNLSSRAAHPFVALNCAAIPETMIESELFGHLKGSFTGALRDKRGRFALADRGTLFLDEIGDLDLSAQAKLLRALQQGEIQPIGAEKVQRVNVRIISATHKDLLKAIGQGRFREDLYYRLNVVEIETPPLRERGDDIELLAHTFIQSLAAEMRKTVDGFTAAALHALRRHPWPGNVRELRNEMERAAIHVEGPLVDVGDLSPRIRFSTQDLAAAGPPKTLTERYAQLDVQEKQLVQEAVRTAKGNLSEAARLLGITRIMLKRRMDRFGIESRDD